MKRVLALFAIAAIVLSSCEDEDNPSYYAINMHVEGGSLSQIYFRSTNWNFDVNNVPIHLWSVDNTIYGNDSITLFGSQATPDSTEKVIVTITLQKGTNLPIIFQDSSATSVAVKGFVPF